VGSVVIGGTVKGNIEAVEKLEMLSTGKVFGNIRTAKLKIADGVVFEGKCEMIRNPQALDVFSGSVEQLKKSAQTA
jgi:cytoskeletal protein CcmA (bactofilin family)